MGGDILAAAGVIASRADNLTLGGAGVDNDFAGFAQFPEAVQYLRQHRDGGSDRDGDHDKIAPANTVFEGLQLINEFHPLRGGGVHRILLNAQDPVRESPALEVDRHRSPDEAETDDADCFFIFRDHIPFIHCIFLVFTPCVLTGVRSFYPLQIKQLRSRRYRKIRSRA